MDEGLHYTLSTFKRIQNRRDFHEIRSSPDDVEYVQDCSNGRLSLIDRTTAAEVVIGTIVIQPALERAELRCFRLGRISLGIRNGLPIARWWLQFYATVAKSLMIEVGIASLYPNAGRL